MSNNHHTAISTGAAANASNFNAPLGQLDAAISSIQAGGTPINQLNLGTETELTIASGAITITDNRHSVDTESDASTDALTDILGGAAGDVLILRPNNAARMMTITHNAAKIFLQQRQDMAFDSIYQSIALYCLDGTIWVQISPQAALAISANNSYYYPRDLAVMPDFRARNHIAVKAAAATVAEIGQAAATAHGTPTESNDTDSTYVNLVSGASAGNAAGYRSATYDLLRRQHNPRYMALIRTVASGDLANVRFWIGLTSATPPNADTMVATGSFAGFRYSTVAGDAGFVPVTCDNTTQTVGSMVSGGTVAATTRYLFTLEVNDALGTVTLRINNGAPSTLSTNLPAATTELGWVCFVITTAAAAKNVKFSRVAMDYD